MNKKILSLVLTGVLSASLLVGCKAKDNSAGSDKLIISTWGLNEDVLKKEKLDLLMTTIGGGFSIVSARISSSDIFCSEIQYI